MPDLIWENKEKTVKMHVIANGVSKVICIFCFLFLCNTFVRVVVMLFGIKQPKQNKNISKYLVERI